MNTEGKEFCPVPKEQQPINEYQELKESWFFAWTNSTIIKYCRKIVIIGFWSSLIAAPIASASFSPTEQPLRFTLTTIWGCQFLIVLVLAKLSLGWQYICDRLNNSKITYEESGWYDGQIWEKSLTMLDRDRLVVSYEVRPILLRLRYTFLFMASLAGLGIIVWFVFV